jgi:probable HAF family extracellular repeat protein
MRPYAPLFLLATLAGCDAQDRPVRPTDPPRLATGPSYTVVKLTDDLGGSQSRGMAINRSGWIAGWSDHADGTRSAALWRGGAVTDLQTLGGPGSTVPWQGLNDAGTVVGISLTAETDPLDEDWSCELGGFIPTPGPTSLVCRGFVWQGGAMRELAPLGGTHSFATGINAQGQIVGWAETAVHDPSCVDKQVLGFRAATWEPKPGSNGRIKARELRPWPGDSASAATAINDAGQAVGISGRCDQAVGRFSALRAIRWGRNGKPDTLPTLGGHAWHTPMDINERGDVVGFSNPPGDGTAGDFIAHAFIVPDGAAAATDLRTLPGDALSEAFAINERGQVVGVSFGGSEGSRAFLWQNDVLLDLNDLVDIAPDVLLSAQDIDDEGRITGRVRDGVTGEVMVFVATPIGVAP